MAYPNESRSPYGPVSLSEMFDSDVRYREVFTDEELFTIQKEYARLKDLSYLDHAGCPAYSDSLIKQTLSNFATNVYGNPHSGSLCSKYTLDTVDQVRFKILQYFNTSSNEYSVIFTSGATAALKLVAESFVWVENDNKDSTDFSCETEDKSFFVYVEDNHTSVLGMRDVVSERGVNVMCLEHERAFEVFRYNATSHSKNNKTNSLFVYSLQSNFSGLKYPLSWINKVHNGALRPLIENESNWFCLVDAAAYLSTNKLDLSLVKPDFVALSFYKIFGYPTGLGALLVRNSSSDLLQKRYYGGGTVFVALSKENSYVPRSVIHERFEDGTINFLSIIALSHGFDTWNKVVCLEKTSVHCFELAKYVYYCLSRLHHSNGRPAVVLYSDTSYEDIITQGNIVNFNLLRSNGEYVGYAEVLQLANLHGIHLRTGCFCNPGACRRHLRLTTEDVKKHYMSGHVCGDSNDLIDGLPTGSIRISFGLYTSHKDVYKLLNMIVNCFIQKPVVQKFPDDWIIKNKILMDKFSTKNNQIVYIDERLKAMSCLYFWFENVCDPVTDYNPLYGYTKTVMINSTKNGIIRENIGSTTTHLSNLCLYPVKSCGKFSVEKWEISPKGLRYDREWMITNHSGISLTQKIEPRLCLIKPVINIEQQKLTLNFKGYPSFCLDINSTQGHTQEGWFCSSKVCSDSIQGIDCGDSVSLWLSHVLRKDGLRLIKQLKRESSSLGKLSLSNQAQYLLINKKSVDWLSDKLEDNTDCKKESMLDRFRSNLVVSDVKEPFVEQQWTKVTIGKQEFKVDGPCGRCQMICIDQETGDKTKEPLTTLAAASKGKLKFGIYLTALGSNYSTLSIGDPITFESQIVN